MSSSTTRAFLLILFPPWIKINILIDKYTVICSEPNEIVIKGEYQLTSIEGDDTYIVTSILSKKLKFDNLVFPFNNQNLTQTVNGDNPSFSLSLLSEVTDLPSIYVGSTRIAMYSK